MNHTWQDVAIAFVAALPAMVAAISSLRNGRKIERHDARIVKVVRDDSDRRRIGRN